MRVEVRVEVRMRVRASGSPSPDPAACGPWWRHHRARRHPPCRAQLIAAPRPEEAREEDVLELMSSLACMSAWGTRQSVYAHGENGARAGRREVCVGECAPLYVEKTADSVSAIAFATTTYTAAVAAFTSGSHIRSGQYVNTGRVMASGIAVNTCTR